MADHELPLPPSPDDPAPDSPVRRWLLGCGCGCAVLLALLAFGLIFLGKKLWGPGVQLPSDHLLREDSVAAVQLDSPTSSAEARTFLVEAFRAVMIAQLEQLDEDEASSQDIEQILAGLEDMESAGAGFGPSSFTLVLAPGGPSADELSMAFAMNLENGAPLMRFGLEYLGLAGSTEHERDGKVAYEFDGGEATIKTSTTVNGIQTSEEIQLAEELDVSFFVGFVHDTAIFSDSKELLLDTLVATDFEETPGAPPASPLRRELADLRSDWLLAAAMVDHPLLDPADVLAADLLDTDLDLGWTEVPFGAARLGIGVDGRDLNLRIEVDGLDPGDVGQVAAGFEELAAVRRDQLEAHGLDLAHEVLAGETSLLVQVGLPDLRTWLETKATEGIQELEVPPVPPTDPAEPIDPESADEG